MFGNCMLKNIITYIIKCEQTVVNAEIMLKKYFCRYIQSYILHKNFKTVL